MVLKLKKLKCEHKTIFVFWTKIEPNSKKLKELDLLLYMLFIYQSDSIKGIISTFFIKKLVEEKNFDEIEYDPRLHFPFDV